MPRTVIRFAVIAGVMLLVAANAHLVYVAVVSQPDCIPHIRRGDSGDGNGRLAAASSAC